MKRIVLTVALFALGGLAAAQQGPTAKSSTGKKSVQIPAKPTDPSEVKKVPGFSVENMDNSVNPCQDFYEYACGTWRKNNPIPADQTRWGRFNTLSEANTQVLHQIVEDLAKKKDRTQLEQQVGDFYSACMDEEAIDKRGAAPLKAEMEKIDSINSKQGLIDYVATLHARGVPAFFGFSASPNLHDSRMNVANFSQGGLTLDREDYTEEGAERDKIRQQYVEHVARMLHYLGDDEAKASAEAKRILEIETQLAQMALKRVELRNPKNRDNPMKFSELEQSAPNLYLAEYVKQVGAAPFTDINVINPKFFAGLNSIIDQVPLSDWKTYLRWHVLHEAAPMLAKEFRDENFDFFSRTLNGQQQEQPRWKRCTRATDRGLGEALGQFYVKEAFGADAKARMKTMVAELESALHTDIANLDWMSAETKPQAEEKLAAIINKVGYPDKWKDYSSVKISATDPIANLYAVQAYERNRNIKKIGQPVDKSEWGMTPPTVNAYYSSAVNEIVFPAGILQPPFFDRTLDDAVNYGGIGVVIGHELTHGFDDQGRKFDATGNFRDWWTPQDGEEFDKRVSCIADEYSSFEPVEGVHLNGRLTLGENTADNGGARIAMMALLEHLKKTNPAGLTKVVDGFTPEQRFYLGFAQVWCENIRPEAAKRGAQSDPHSPGRFRVNGTLGNSPEFDKAFGCKKGDAMVREQQCHVW